MSDTVHILTIDHLERMDSSVNGNPRYRVFFTDGRALPTQPDAAWSYEAPNRENIGVPLEVHVNGRGHVTYARRVEGDAR